MFHGAKGAYGHMNFQAYVTSVRWLFKKEKTIPAPIYKIPEKGSDWSRLDHVPILDQSLRVGILCLRRLGSPAHPWGQKAGYCDIPSGSPGMKQR